MQMRMIKLNQICYRPINYYTLLFFTKSSYNREALGPTSDGLNNLYPAEVFSMFHPLFSPNGNFPLLFPTSSCSIFFIQWPQTFSSLVHNVSQNISKNPKFDLIWVPNFTRSQTTRDIFPVTKPGIKPGCFFLHGRTSTTSQMTPFLGIFFLGI